MSSMSQDVVPLYSKSISETLTDTDIKLNISLLVKDATLDNLFIAEPKPKFKSETFCL